MSDNEKRYKIKKIEQFNKILSSKRKDMVIKTIQISIVMFGVVCSNLCYMNVDNDISKTISLIVACIYSFLLGKSIKDIINLKCEIRECCEVIKRIEEKTMSKVSLDKESLEIKPKQKVNLIK